MSALPEEERLNAITVLQHGRAHVKCQICWVSLNLHTRGIIDIVFLMWSLSTGGRLRNINPTQQWMCVKTIVVGGLDNVVDARIALSEHLNVVVSTNTVKCALHEASFGSSKKLKKLLLLTTKNVYCKLEFAQHHQDWTIHDWYMMIFSEEIKFNQFQCDGLAWCWVRDGEPQLQAHLVSQRIKHEGGAILCGVV